MAEDSRSIPEQLDSPGPYLAKIVSHLDPYYMGSLEVEILRSVGAQKAREGQIHRVSYLSPFYGVTNVEFNGENDTYNETQKSYGMWFVPPDVGTTVMVIFVDGDPRKGYWLGCIADQYMNFMVPGYASTELNVNGKSKRVPVGEYNKKVTQVAALDPTKTKKPAHPFQDILQEQGLLNDDIRGLTSSSARREIPSSVFGVSTPGPIDKQNNARKGKVGKFEHQIANAFVSRLGGSSFVMDDGDDKFLRKTKASEGPPEYASVEQRETGGNVTIPHNELLRLKTRTGHQILLHNSEDLIYIGNARGTTWIEMTSDGKIDIYAQDSVSVHTEQDFNLKADRDVNIEAGRNINLKTLTGQMQTQTATDWNVIVGANGKITVATNMDVNVGNSYKETAARIDMNGPTAQKATPLSTHTLPKGESTVTSITKRQPQHEPWQHHENLDPLQFKPSKTDRNVTDALTTPTKFKQYSTVTDTFKKVKGSGN